MKASIAGLALLGSLVTGTSTTPANHKESSSAEAYSQKLHHKDAVVKILELQALSQMEGFQEGAESYSGDLFLELVPSIDYGNITKERQAIAVMIQDVTRTIFEGDSNLSISQRSKLLVGVSELASAHTRAGNIDYPRSSFENDTYEALLKLVTAFDADSLGDLRSMISIQKLDNTRGTFESDPRVSPSIKKQNVHDTSSIEGTRIDSRLREYISLFQMELVYLSNNPELLESCKINKDREELRLKAITWIQKIIQTTPSKSSEMNSSEHESARNHLFKIRKQLYPDGELGYIYAQEWGGAEIMRRKKELVPPQKRTRV